MAEPDDTDDGDLPLGVETAVDALEEMRSLADRIEATMGRQEPSGLKPAFGVVIDGLRDLADGLQAEAERVYPEFDWAEEETEESAP